MYVYVTDDLDILTGLIEYDLGLPNARLLLYVPFWLFVFSAIGIPTIQSNANDEIEGNSTVEVENTDSLLIDESANSTDAVDGSTANATSTVRPKRIACLRREPRNHQFHKHSSPLLFDQDSIS